MNPIEEEKADAGDKSVQSLWPKEPHRRDPPGGYWPLRCMQGAFAST
jgi:hypothetical protein